MTSPATSSDTPNSSAIPTRHPEGLEEAKVALTTINTDAKVMYHLRAFDQFFGFSMSLGLKSKWPFSFRNGVVLFSISLLRYGLAVGLESSRSSLFRSG